MGMSQNNTQSSMKFLQAIPTEATVTGTEKRRNLADSAATKGIPTLATPQAAASNSCETLLQVADVQRSQANCVKVELRPRKAAEARSPSLQSSAEGEAWVKRTQTEAAVLSAPRSLRFAQSGVRAWGRFTDRVLRAGGRRLPPSPEGIAAWSHLYRHADTLPTMLAMCPCLRHRWSRGGGYAYFSGQNGQSCSQKGAEGAE